MTADNRGRTLLHPAPPAEAISSSMSGTVMKSRSRPLRRGLGNQSSHLQECTAGSSTCHRATGARSSCARHRRPWLCCGSLSTAFRALCGALSEASVSVSPRLLPFGCQQTAWGMRKGWDGAVQWGAGGKAEGAGEPGISAGDS